ncbi:hypothetical protein LC040_10640 [Bacillus tianshenii]|nr:hypothetical protein LC040_10640 [Bacillus tianshenii]
MLRSSDGFYLLELLISFGLLMSFIVMVSPAVMSLQVKYEEIKSEHASSYVLEKSLYDYVEYGINPNNKKTYNGFEFTIHGWKTGSVMRICVQSTNLNGKTIERCTYGKKK